MFFFFCCYKCKNKKKQKEREKNMNKKEQLVTKEARDGLSIEHLLKLLVSP